MSIPSDFDAGSMLPHRPSTPSFHEKHEGPSSNASGSSGSTIPSADVDANFVSEGRWLHSTSGNEQRTPTSSTLGQSTLLPPFTMRHSQLPTPQSPSNTGALYNHSPDTPLANSSTHRASHFDIFEQSQSETMPMLAAAFITPESSPMFARRASLHRDVWNESDQPIPSSSSGTSRTIDPTDTKPESLPVLLAPAARITSPMSSRSQLSSPFMGRLSMSERARQSRMHTPGHTETSVPMQLDEPFRPAPLSSRSSPPLPAPIPQRPAGAEIERIRLQLAAEEAARMEARRPEYLRRAKRQISEVELTFEDGQGGDAHDSFIPSLGVAVSPMKGRRLQLFQETSEESFEQSLLAGGYPRYGDTPAYVETQAPVPQRKESLSQRAMEWLQQATPGRPGPSTVEPEPNWSEKEIRKRKRLALFEAAPVKEHETKLWVAELEGQGRIILNHPPESSAHPEGGESSPPKKRRGTKRKRRGGAAQSPAKRKSRVAEPEETEVVPIKPNWLDSSFPWCMRTQEREERARAEKEERMRCIERFLDRSSDEEEEPEAPDEESQDSGKTAQYRIAPPDRHVCQTPSERADAMSVFLAKRSVRAFAWRSLPPPEDSDEEVVCVCNGKNDGRELVQCDDCHTWYHLKCIGIKSVDELGREEDPWYCDNCLGVHMDLTPSDPVSEPTFVPTDDRPVVVDAAVRDTLFYQGGMQESPSTPWGAVCVPKTPVRGQDRGDVYSSRSSWDSSKGAPSTPFSSTQSVRIYTTPGLFDQFEQDDAAFDAATTPSRGITCGAAFTTPKGSGSGNGYRIVSALPKTPSRDERERAGARHATLLLPALADGSSPPSSSPARNVYAFDDSPIRRTKPREDARGGLWDSPPGLRPAGAARDMLQDSPLYVPATYGRWVDRENPLLEAARRGAGGGDGEGVPHLLRSPVHALRSTGRSFTAS